MALPEFIRPSRSIGVACLLCGQMSGCILQADRSAIMVAVSVEHRRFGFWRDRITHPLQGGLLWLLFAFLRVLPIDGASALGGLIGRTVGPRLGMSRRA